jgi:hypothetical protein
MIVEVPSALDAYELGHLVAGKGTRPVHHGFLGRTRIHGILRRRTRDVSVVHGSVGTQRR